MALPPPTPPLLTCPLYGDPNRLMCGELGRERLCLNSECWFPILTTLTEEEEEEVVVVVLRAPGPEGSPLPPLPASHNALSHIGDSLSQCSSREIRQRIKGKPDFSLFIYFFSIFSYLRSVSFYHLFSSLSLSLRSSV